MLPSGMLHAFVLDKVITKGNVLLEENFVSKPVSASHVHDAVNCWF